MGGMSPRFNEDETHLIKLLAEHSGGARYEFIDDDELAHRSGLSSDRFHTALKALEGRGLIEERAMSGGSGKPSLAPAPRVLDLHREIQARHEAQRKAEQQPPDIVAQLQARARRHPVWARVIIVGLVAALVLPAIAALVTIIERAWRFYLFLSGG